MVSDIRTTDHGAPPLGHTAAVPPRIGPDPERLDAGSLAVYTRIPVAAISDAVARLYTLDPGIAPLYRPMRRVVGVALTVKAPPGDNFAIYGGLARAFPGAVLVVDWRGYVGGCGGGAKALPPATARGLAGLVIDGAWRDAEEVAAADVPVCARGTAPYSPGKRELGEVNVPVHCGGVVVEPGDVVVADGDGAVVVPRRHAVDVAALLARRAPTEAADDEAMVARIEQSYERAVDGVLRTAREH